MAHASVIQLHYAGLPSDNGFESRCRIILPSDLAGKTALDVCCRRGKGVYKLSERVGASGRAIGVDWREDFIDAARAHADAALSRSGLAENNMIFHVAYPELLSTCVEPGSIDLAFINDVLNLTFSPTEVLRQIHAVLKPGGVLVCQTVVSEYTRDADSIATARAKGDSIGAAPDRATLSNWIEAAGFELALVEEIERKPVSYRGAA